MRKALEKIGAEERHIFTGVFERKGAKSSFGYLKWTVLLLNIKDQNGKEVTDHLWFNETKGFAELQLQKGDVVEFCARVAKYQKGYKGFRTDVYVAEETDYKLSYPTKIKKIGHIEIKENEKAGE